MNYAAGKCRETESPALLPAEAVPTTPNPTSGFFLMVPKADVIELDMSVEDALKYLISMGVVAPAVLPVKTPEAISAEATHQRADTYAGD